MTQMILYFSVVKKRLMDFFMDPNWYYIENLTEQKLL